MNANTTLTDALCETYWYAEQPSSGAVVTAATKIDEALEYLPVNQRAHVALSYVLFQFNVRLGIPAPAVASTEGEAFVDGVFHGDG